MLSPLLMPRSGPERPSSYDRRAHVARVRQRLVDPRAICDQLGLLEGYQPVRQARGLVIRCPVHGDRTPSCSVTRGPEGTLRVRCFGCDLAGDVFTLIAAARGLDARRDFPAVLSLAEGLGGLSPIEAVTRSNPSRLPPEPERTYPPLEEVTRLWEAGLPVAHDDEARAHLAARGLAAAAVDLFDLARVLPADAPLPMWARHQRRSWIASGHRLLVPMHDARGEQRSVRAWRLVEGETPKRLPPAGHRAAGLVMANPLGRALLERGAAPEGWPAVAPLRVIIAEGEPDFLTWATRFSDADLTAPAVFGVVQGSWTPALAARIPDGARVTVRTDPDAAGAAYARLVQRTLGGRCVLLRPRAPAP